MRPSLNVGSLVEWLAAALGAAVVLWMAFSWAEPWLRREPVTTSVDANEVPPGVPSNAQSVPLLVLVDGTTVRVGDTETDVHTRLGRSPDDPEPSVSEGLFGDRLAHSYERHGTRFFLVCERTEPGGTVRVARIYLPR